MKHVNRLIRFLLAFLLLVPVWVQVWAATPPGAKPYPNTLSVRLQATLKSKGADYRPRTKHLKGDGQPLYTNRLILEDSPYLLQHAHNPVNWFAWGDKAFEVARREDKPIFLSIGYSTCHWCHVMEHESFEDQDIGRYLNEHFISIKVDRERRPDVDEAYMIAVMGITGRGGWPMSVFLAPDGKPFYGGTYFPPDAFGDLLHRIHDAWETQRDVVLTQSGQIAAAVTDVMNASGKVDSVGKAAIQHAVIQLTQQYEPEFGGFGRAPKFPRAPVLLFLLQAAERNGDTDILPLVEHTLAMMSQGGIYDQVGGGFHRYATDGQWLVPHFEKMLYTQALMARVYLLAYRLTGKSSYARTAREILDYVLRDMQSPEGGFYSATDADSDGKEGTFFLWTPDQLREILGSEDAKLAQAIYGVTAQGNFEGKNILHLPASLTEYAGGHDLQLPVFLKKLDTIREQLRIARDRRIPPLRDDKIVVAWNAMMIDTLAQATEILQSSQYLKTAIRAAAFLWRTQWKEDGDLWRVNLNGSASIAASQDDYAYFAQALISLYDADGDLIWLSRARMLADAMLKRFWDAEHGGFFLSAEGSTLYVRPKHSSDTAIPSGNSAAVRMLARLAQRTGERRYRDKANAAISTFASAIGRDPSTYSYMLTGVDELLNGEMGSKQYGARGAVGISSKVIDEGEKKFLRIGLDIAKGWHVNGHQPLQQDLIPTELRLDKQQAWKLGAVEYPEPKLKRLSFEPKPLALYQGTVDLNARLTRAQPIKDSPNLLRARLRFQACNNKICLAPETLVLDAMVPRSNRSMLIER